MSEMAKALREKGYYPSKEVAEKLGVHVGTVYRWVAANKVESRRVGNTVFISRASLVKMHGEEVLALLAVEAS